MANPLLDRILPAELADRSQTVEFKGNVGDFERLREIAGEATDAEAPDKIQRDWPELPVTVSLAFSWLDTDRRLPAATGNIQAQLPAICQRCLEPFKLAVETPVRILFAGEHSEAGERSDFELWDSGDEAIRLQDVIEESIVMAMPLAPAHQSSADCGELASQIPEREPDTVRPFADLRAQMEDRNK